MSEKQSSTRLIGHQIEMTAGRTRKIPRYTLLGTRDVFMESSDSDFCDGEMAKMRQGARVFVVGTVSKMFFCGINYSLSK